MKCNKWLTLNLNSNLSNYQIQIYNESGYLSKEITKNRDCIKFCARPNFFYIVATNTSLFNSKTLTFLIYLDGKNCLNLDFSSAIVSQNQDNVYTFTLNDENYGFGIDGTLNFISV